MGDERKRPPSGPERLRAYDLALHLGDAVDLVIESCRLRPELAKQLRRAVDSVILNIAEGASSFSPGRKRYHYEVAHGSAGECIAVFTRILRQRHCLAALDARRKANMLSVMLARLIPRRKD